VVLNFAKMGFKEHAQPLDADHRAMFVVVVRMGVMLVVMSMLLRSDRH